RRLVGQAQQHDVGFTRHLRGRLERPASQRGELLHVAAAKTRHRETRLDQIRGHRQAELPDADHSHSLRMRRHGLVSLLYTTILSALRSLNHSDSLIAIYK